MTAIHENDRVYVSEMLFYVKNKLATTPKNVIIDTKPVTVEMILP